MLAIPTKRLIAPRRVVLAGGAGGGTPTVQVFTGSGTYTKPAGLKAALVRLVGGGGEGSDTGVNSGNAGGTTSFGALLSATGGAGGPLNPGTVAGGVGSGGNLNLTGGGGGGPVGGTIVFGGAGISIAPNGSIGIANTGAGGGGTGFSTSTGGAAGGYAEEMLAAASIGATETVTIGAGGTGGSAGSAGGSGVIVVVEFY